MNLKELKMKYWIVIMCLGISFLSNAQEVIVNDIVYEVKGETITKNGEDVSKQLTDGEKQQIKRVLKDKIATSEKIEKLEKTQKKKEKEQKKREKDLKKAQKKQKQAEKALKQKQKSQKNFNNAKKKYLQAQSKYENLKKRGKLSPDDEAKWLNKIEKLNKNVLKAERKL